MTIDEAIKQYTNNAEYERTHGNLQGCLDFRQLAEWLKELKALEENNDVKDVFKDCDTCKYLPLEADDYPCDRCCHRYINQYVYDDRREANADADSN